MDLATTTPNLRGFTRFLSGDRTSAAANLFSDQEVDDAINMAYQELWSLARRMDVGWGRNTTTETSVADQILYNLPSDLDGRIINIEIELDGKDLTSDSDAESTYLEALRDYREGGLTTTKYYFIQGQQYGIVSPPTVGGSNSIRILYEQGITLLTNTTDTPNIPTAHHQLLCYMAAVTLLSSQGIDAQDMRIEMALRFPWFLEAVAEPAQNLDFQIPVAGRVPARNLATQTGFFKGR